VFHFRKCHQFASTVAFLVACAFSTSCTAWHPISLQPQRFSADTSPEWVRVTLKDSTRFTASYPVLSGDSLVWIDWGATPRDSTRSAVLTSSIQRAEVRRADTTGTIVLLLFVGGAVGGLYYFVHHVVPTIGGN
jgi:hypothetical protein